MASLPFLPGILLLLLSCLLPTAAPTQICIIGSGIGGSSLSHFLTSYSSGAVHDIRVFERNGVVGGRMATVTVGGDTFEAGASILHPKNYHAANFTAALGLRRSDRPKSPDDSDSWFGIWDGSRFVFKTLAPPDGSSSMVYKKIYSVLNSVLVFWRYGLSLFRMNSFVQDMLNNFLLYYKKPEERPVFETVEEMLKWSGLYSLTRRTLKEELAEAGLSLLLISELVTVITRINYGQDVTMSGLAGAISLAGSGGGLWSVVGGNWQMAAGLIELSNATLHLNEEISAVTYTEGHYELISAKGNNYSCGVTVIATPLDELNIKLTPPISIPSRKLQHTHTTFVRGLLNPAYFGLSSVSEIPVLVGTLEVSNLPFSCISVLRKYSKQDMTYKVFSRNPLNSTLLDKIFSVRKETLQIDWPAYPHYKAPEEFAPFLLDKQHLYYINSFESAASAIETSAVAAENIARLILSRLKTKPADESILRSILSHQDDVHTDIRAAGHEELR